MRDYESSRFVASFVPSMFRATVTGQSYYRVCWERRGNHITFERNMLLPLRNSRGYFYHEETTHHLPFDLCKNKCCDPEFLVIL